MANYEKLAPNIPNLFAEEDAAIREERPIEGKSFENTLAFLSEHTISPDTKTLIPKSPQGQNLGQWEQAMRILGQYFGTDKTNEEIADELDVTKQNVNHIIKMGIRRLHKSASWKLKAKYPFESLSSRKPLPIASGRRHSEVQGGIAVRAEQMVSEGKTPAEIKQELGGSARLGVARQTLRGWDINTPLEKNPILPAFKELANTELSDEDLRALLNKVQNTAQYRALLKAGLIVNLTSLARRAGLYLTGQDIPRVHEVLAQDGIPQGKTPNHVKGEDGERKILGRYYFIAAMDEAKSIATLKRSRELADLKINPVKVIGAPVKTIPNTTELMWRSGKYRSVLKLAGQIAGSKVNSRKLNRNNIVAGIASVSFYTIGSRGGLLYEAEHEDAAIEHLKMRMKELGII